MISAQELKKQLEIVKDSLAFRYYEKSKIEEAIYSLIEEDNLTLKHVELLERAIIKYKLI